MKSAQSITHSFSTLPKDYAGLCGVLLPRPIHDKIGYQNTVEMADAFAGFESMMNRDQRDYFDLLSTLIEDYDASKIKAPKQTGTELVKHLLAEHKMTGVDLSRMLGKSDAVGRMLLRGEREITPAHARIMAEKFGLPAGLFLGL